MLQPPHGGVQPQGHARGSDLEPGAPVPPVRPKFSVMRVLVVVLSVLVALIIGYIALVARVVSASGGRWFWE